MSDVYESLKAIWKKLGINGQIKNYSDIDIWVVENSSQNKPLAHILKPGFKTLKEVL